MTLLKVRTIFRRVAEILTSTEITEGNATINPFLDLCYTRLPCDAEDERYFVVRFAQAVFAAANSDASPTPQLPLTLFATQPPRNKLRLLVYRINKPKLSSPAEIHRYWEDHCRPLLTLGNPVAFVYRDLERMTADRSSKRQEVLENETGVTLKDILQNLGPSWISMAHRMVTIVPDTGSDACDEAMVVLDDAIEKSKGSTSATAISGI